MTLLNRMCYACRAPASCNQGRSKIIAVRKSSNRWYYDFTVRRVRYRGVIPEARTRWQAQQAGNHIRDRIWEGNYDPIQDRVKLSEFATEDNLRVRYLTEAEEKRLPDALLVWNTNLRPLVVLALHMGIRVGELTCLRWQQVDFERGQIRVTKTGIDCSVPTNGESRAPLEQLRQASPMGEPVFNEVSKLISTNCWRPGKKAGLEDFHFHDLRHHLVTKADGERKAGTA